MENLVILNTIGIWSLILFLLFWHFRGYFTFEVKRTFFFKTAYGMELTVWNRKNNYTSRRGKVLLDLDWKNEEKLKLKEDNERNKHSK